MDDPRLKTFKEIAKLLQDSVTKEEFQLLAEKLVATVKEIKNATDNELKTINNTLAEVLQTVSTRLSDGEKELKDSLTKSIDDTMSKMMLEHEAMMAECDAKMGEMKDGEDGKDADEEAMLAKLEAKIPPRMTAIEIRDALESIQPEDEQLNIEAIRGLKEILEKLEMKVGAKTTVIGGSHPLSTLPDVNAQGISDGQVLAWSASLNRFEPITPSGGTGMTQLTATEIPNGTRTVFTFSSASAKPSFIVADNVWLKETTKSGFTNWSWSAGLKQATLTIPPNEDVWGVV